jgi:hypothetical protein
VVEKKAKTKIKIGKNPRVRYVETNDFWFQWCCKCKLRHIWHLEVARGKTPKDDVIKISGVNDEVATELRKFYDKSKQKP